MDTLLNHKHNLLFICHIPVAGTVKDVIMNVMDALEVKNVEKLVNYNLTLHHEPR